MFGGQPLFKGPVVSGVVVGRFRAVQQVPFLFDADFGLPPQCSIALMSAALLVHGVSVLVLGYF